MTYFVIMAERDDDGENTLEIVEFETLEAAAISYANETSWRTNRVAIGSGALYGAYVDDKEIAAAVANAQATKKEREAAAAREREERLEQARQAKAAQQAAEEAARRARLTPEEQVHLNWLLRKLDGMTDAGGAYTPAEETTVERCVIRGCTEPLCRAGTYCSKHFPENG